MRRARAAAALAAGLGALAIGAGIVAAAGSGAPRQAGKPELRRIASFERPVGVVQAPGQPHTLYVVEQPGRIMLVRHGVKRREPFLDIRDLVRFGPEESNSNEAGLLSLAFDPRYGESDRFFVFYTGTDGDNRVVSFRHERRGLFDASRASKRRVIRIPHPWRDTHNGGQIAFGPDGNLWVSTGDGRCCGDHHDQARSLGTLLGKLLRIHPNRSKPGFSPAPGNPLVGVPGLNAIYSWGLRNPWRFSFDRASGDLALTDVGDRGPAQEELNLVSIAAARGANFGWPQFEGLTERDPTRPAQPAPTFPSFVYSQDAGECAITGGYVVRDPRLPELWGRYLYADFCAGGLKSVGLAPPGANGPGWTATDVRGLGLRPRFPASFGEGLDGRIFVVSHAGGLLRLERRRPRG